MLIQTYRVMALFLTAVWMVWRKTQNPDLLSAQISIVKANCSIIKTNFKFLQRGFNNLRFNYDSIFYRIGSTKDFYITNFRQSMLLKRKVEIIKIARWINIFVKQPQSLQSDSSRS